MKTFSEILKRFRRAYTDIVGVDIGVTGVKAVRLRADAQGVTLVAADILPPVLVPASSDAVKGVLPALHLPKVLRARFVAMAVSGQAGMIKLLTFPPHAEKTTEMQVSELMGIGDSRDYRLAYELISDTRSEIKVLAVALPLVTVHSLCQLFPTGTPAPCSIEMSGLASLTAFGRAPGRTPPEDGVAVVDFGASVSIVAFFNRGSLVLLRKFDFGTSAVLKKVQEGLGVDLDVALGIMADGSFDISQIVRHAMESFVQQLVISRDFVERRENCHVRQLYVCGGPASLRSWGTEVQSATGLELIFWNPFDGLTVAPGALDAKWKGQESRFTGAVGAALGMLGTL